MSEKEKDRMDDIWVKGIKTICGHHKKSLLDYIDALDPGKNSNDVLGLVKAKVHNDLSQVQFMIGVLFETFRSGGSIKPFEDSFNRSQYRGHNAHKNKINKVNDDR